MSLSAYYYGPSTLGHFLEPSLHLRSSPAFSCDVTESQDTFTIKADMPGTKKESIDIKIEKQVLTIQTQREESHVVESEKVYFRERSTGSMSRSFKLPPHVLADSAKCSFEDATLTITFTKDPAYATTRKLEIQ
jgi:HSP20 family protein